MVFQAKDTTVRYLTLLYFSVIVLYSICVYFDFEELRALFGFLRIPVLLVLYYVSSVKRDLLYFLALIVFQAAYIFFGKNTDTGLLYGAIASVLYRFILILIVLKAIHDKRWDMVFLTSLPILFIYLYLIDLIKDSIANSYYIWILNGILTAFLGGLAVINYCYKDDQKSFWLLLSALLFVIQIGLFFVNKFYLKQELFLHMIIILYGISHYTFYKFMVFKDREKS